MREAVKDAKRLEDILKSIDTVLRYVEGVPTVQDFVKDSMRYHAVIYNIMVMGEAANMLTFEFRDAHPLTPWKQITGMRNFLIHGYHHVEEELVWKVITEELIPLRSQIVEYMKEF